MTKYLSIAALAAVLASGGAWVLNRSNSETGSSDLALTPGAALAQGADTTQTATDGADAEAITIQDMTQGDPDAPVAMMEYASFTCPHCAAFHADQYPQLKAEYIDTGLVHFTYREVFFDRFGLWAALVARCGGEMRYFGIAEQLYAQQRDWIAGGQDPALIADNLRRIGLVAGLEQDQLDACLNDAATAEALYAWYQANAEADEVNATPTLFIDGTKYSNMSYADLSALLDERLVAAGVEPPAN
jgi:protein-disulfide isomerase